MVKKILNAMGLSGGYINPGKELLEIVIGSILIVLAPAAFYILMAVFL